MPKTPVAQVPAKLYELLSPLEPHERARVVQATLILFGEELPAAVAAGGASSKPAFTPPGTHPTDASTYFDQKAPKNKGEILAVAARFREEVEKQETHTKADIKAVITGARRNFDDANFARDLNNAKRQAGFFNLGTGRSVKLSYFGQQFVDALPDREAAAKLHRPKVGGNRKRAVRAKGGAK
jgi:hypothetical protein